VTSIDGSRPESEPLTCFEYIARTGYGSTEHLLIPNLKDFIIIMSHLSNQDLNSKNDPYLVGIKWSATRN
jgi:hypothetical protein